MILLPIGIVFAGYTITYYGFSLLKGPGMGLLDLLLPGRVSNADAVIQGWKGLRNPDGLNPATAAGFGGDFVGRGSAGTGSKPGAGGGGGAW